MMGVSLPHDAQSSVLIGVRTLHILAGITWVGLLYFLVINTRPLRELEPPVRARVLPVIVSPTLWWFRWSSVVTVLTGIWYWMHIVATDHHNAIVLGVTNTSSGRAIGTFFGLWTFAFILYMGALMSPLRRSGAAVGLVAAVVAFGAAYFYVALNQHGWESNRLLAIGIGGGLGWFMMLNVWGVVWRAQKKIIRWTAEGKAGTPDFLAQQRLAYLASRTNFVLTFPLVFFMGAASHYLMFLQR